MISIFDLEKLRGLLRDFYEISHIRITVFDENRYELVSYPEEVAPYCAVICGTLQGFEACMRCDREVCEKASKMHSTHIYRSQRIPSLFMHVREWHVVRLGIIDRNQSFPSVSIMTGAIIEDVVCCVYLKTTFII